MQSLKTVEYRGYSYQIVVDEDPTSPREDDNLGTIVYRKNSRYVLGDKPMSDDELRALSTNEEVFAFPVYAFIHSGTSVSMTGFGDPWDSGQSGFIYCLKTVAGEEYMNDATVRDEEDLRARVKARFEGEIKAYDAYLQGQIVGFVTSTGESCWGFYDADDCEAEAKAMIDYVADKRDAILAKALAGELHLAAHVRHLFAEKAEALITKGPEAMIEFLRTDLGEGFFKIG